MKKKDEVTFELVQELLKMMKENKEFLANMVRSNQNMEDTMLNVLLAIRQNEYLQAYYPAQLGHPDIKVVGHHPASPFAPKSK